MQQMLHKLWIFFFGIVASLVVVIITTGPSSPEVSETQIQAPEPTRYATYEEMLERGDDAIYVENQQSDQSRVQIGFVVLSKPGFIVVYGDDGGVPGSIIGESDLLESGGEHLTVLVDEVLSENQVYYAMLYHDDGDGRFWADEDVQVVDSEQTVVLMSFLVGFESKPESGSVLP